MEAKDIQVEYLDYDNEGNDHVYAVYENVSFKGGIVLEDFIFGYDTHQVEFEGHIEWRWRLLRTRTPRTFR